ncbi:LacI family DNA-binding transcriptional regulator [Demequina litorisediminis]|uniref:Transcriptional regulator n=1 Tax=Demequina litorisediminis TaxID=1849022 RepID=A0ABQ6IIQ8_9MICO|nr:LacI family DNA-binding transcriptional regulator [Demequina litorisediminis]GMA36584.1 transcriptional regulator [Demequina litorisediminis]
MHSTDHAAPTIVDVARAAGVSKSLVSLAIRGDAGVSEATRTRILAVADTLGYRSNVLARGLARGRTQVLGVLVSDLSNPYHSDVVAGIEARAEGAGLGTVIGHGQGDPAVLAARLDQMLDLGVDGVIVVSAMLPAEALDTAAARRPVVMVGRPFEQPRRVSVVRNHDERGAALAVAHLQDLGHHGIVHLASSHRAAASARRLAYGEAMTRAGLPSTTLWVDEGGVETLIAGAVGSAGPTACFAGNDRTAAALLHDALDAGLDVPAAFSIVGYDDAQIARQVRPGLTTVAQPREAIGREAARLLLARIDGDKDTVEVTLEPSLTVRGTTAAPC